MSATGEVERVLASIPILQEADEAARRRLAGLAIARNYPQGNILFYHRDPGDTVWIVLRGRVKLCLMSEDGREVILAALHAGDVLGLVAALDGGPHTGTAITATDCRLARIPAERFAGWLREHPGLQDRLLVHLASMVRHAYERIGEQALLSVKRRLRAALFEIARAEGDPARGEEVVFVRPTHRELAGRVGSSRVVISRAFKELLEEEEDLYAEGRTIHVSMEALVTHEDF